MLESKSDLKLPTALKIIQFLLYRLGCFSYGYKTPAQSELTDYQQQTSAFLTRVQESASLSEGSVHLINMCTLLCAAEF
jgi:hypothetical protein